jgi:hypothetical protein
MGLIGIETAIIIFNFLNKQVPDLYLVYLMMTNLIAMFLFLLEGLSLYRKTKSKNVLLVKGAGGYG